jgi:hypothetical protein
MNSQMSRTGQFKNKYKQSVVVHSCNPSTQGAEAGEQ